MNITPSQDEVLDYDGPERFVALSVALLADTETPISAFRRLSAGRSNSFLLESVEGGELMGRYSFLGCGVRERFTFKDGVGTITSAGEDRSFPLTDPLEVIKERLAGWTVWSPGPLPRFHGGAVGYLGFDCVRYFEDVPLPAGPGVDVPEGVLLYTDELAIYDHLRHQLVLVVHAPLSGNRAYHYERATERLAAMVGRLATTSLPPEAPWDMGLVAAAAADTGPDARSNRTQQDMEAAVVRAQEAIVEGEVFQVVASQRFTVEAEVDPLTLYRALRALNPSPYMFFFDFGDFSVVGASPEVLVRLEDGELLLRPIAGTRPRGETLAQDLAYEEDLLADEKELAEHRMLVDLGRNDLGRVAAIGSVKVENPLHIERYSHVMHIVSDARATLDEGRDAYDVFRACFPAGTVSGAPKVRACELLAELEPDRRGLYAGAVGYFDVSGNMDTCIAIRTLVVERDKVHIQAGAGVVYDSVPHNEHEECRNKARAGLRAIQLAMARRR
jgi:anthranilate synthase component I